MTLLPVLDDDENGPARPHHLQCVDRMGTNFAIQSGLNGARKGYIALGPVPALDGPVRAARSSSGTRHNKHMHLRPTVCDDSEVIEYMTGHQTTCRS